MGGIRCGCCTRGPRWPRCEWPATVTRHFRPAGARGPDRSTPPLSPLSSLSSYLRTARETGLSRLSPSVTRRSHPSSLRLRPGISFPSGVATVSSLAPSTRSGVLAFINVQVDALRADHCLERPRQQARPRTLAAVPADTKNTPPSAPKQPGMPPVDSSPPMPHVEGAFDGHVNPRPRPAGQRPRSWPLPITVSRETMSPPSGTYRRRRRPVSAYGWRSSVHVGLHILVGAADHSQAQLTSSAAIHEGGRPLERAGPSRAQRAITSAANN
jgi:hypothetical protein